MTVLPLCIAPDPKLATKCTPVTKVDDEIRQLLDDMLETMYANDGVGLAANQVGITKRIAVMDLADIEEDPQPIKMINPEIIWTSEEQVPMPQGCLSVPEHFDSVTRPEKVKAKYLDENGNPQEIEADGFLAVCIQHEVDHLNGILYIDHLSSLKRKLIMRKVRKKHKSSK